MRYRVTSCVAALGLLALAGQANATTITEFLNTSDPAAGLPAGTLGTVTVTDIFTNNIITGVSIDVSLIQNVNFVNTGAVSRADRISQDVDLVTARINWRFGGPIIGKY